MRASSWEQIRVKPGLPTPLGATLSSHGVQFSLFSRNASSVSLLLFSDAGDSEPLHRLILNPEINRTGDCWHIFVEGLEEGQLYLYQVDGSGDTKQGHRYNKEFVLCDPYSKALTGKIPWARQGEQRSRNAGNAVPKCVVIDDEFDWQGDEPLNHPLWKTIIYETHVRGFTRHTDTANRFDLQHPGTYTAVISMIPYLRELGITSLEFLPIGEFDTHEYENTNYWGYSTQSFFAPKGSYAVSSSGPHQVREFKAMVRELHKAGIEVILDVVFNHTGEGNHQGPSFSFRGIDNTEYYILEQDRRYYKDYSGCGNTMNCNQPVVMDFILDCLRYWVQIMHVDGFRFDLASAMTRDREGRVLETTAPIIEAIAEDAVLGHTKLIAEPWDAAGAYHVGRFHHGRWAEWNDKFRDDVRAFWLGNHGMIQSFATRISGSSDLYIQSGRKPYHSINYITTHDGFTLQDLVSYEEKHNEANGEENRDGSDFNLSCNWGVEGETQDDSILKIRSRMVKNYWATLLLSIGTPMILGGDEFCRSQQGNNNAYCQDNALSWYDFNGLDHHADVYRFAQLIIAFRKKHPALQRKEFFAGKSQNTNGDADIQWFDEQGRALDWSRAENILALRIDGNRKHTNDPMDDVDIIICFNATNRDLHFTLLPPLTGLDWYRVMDTSLDSPDDITENELAMPLDIREGYSVGRTSMVLFIGRR